MFGQLSNVQTQVRTKSVEDEQYFVLAVLGNHVRGVDAHELWLKVLRGEKVEVVPTETFAWVFPELCTNVATQKAA